MTFLTALTAIGALLTAVVTWWQARFTARHQLLAQLDQQWNSTRLLLNRKEAAGLLLRDAEKNRPLDEVLDLLETVAMHWNGEIRETPASALHGIISGFSDPRLLTTEYVWKYFYYPVTRWVGRADAYIRAVQAQDEEGATTWEDLINLRNELLAYEARRQNKTIPQITPSKAALDEYLEEEHSLILPTS